MNQFEENTIEAFKNFLNKETKKIKKLEIQKLIKEKEQLNRFRLLRVCFRKLLPLKIKKIIHFYFDWYNEKIYYSNPTEKKFALDFLNYVLVNNPQIPLSYFPERDYEKILRFIENNFLLAIRDFFLREELFDKKEIERQIFYKNFYQKHKVKKVKNYYEFLGFKSYLNCFDVNIFIENYGLNYFKPIKPNSIILDCGAYIGDSAFIFQQLKPYKIISIEPDEENFNLLSENIKLNGFTNVIPLKIAVGEKNTISRYVSLGGGTYLTEKKDGSVVEVISIDKLIAKYNLKRVDLIKMDIEGTELEALKGAEETIKEFSPKLIISLYHTGKDFFEIPVFLKTIKSDYKFRFVNLNSSLPLIDKVLIAQ